MQMRTVVVAGAALVGATFFATRAVYSQEGGGPEGMTPEQAEMMKKMMELATPGPEHAELAKAVGSWEGEATHFEDPAKPTKSKGTAVCKTILGGRFLVTEYKGDMGGMTFEGMALEGFDNKKKEWFSIWIDSMGTGHMRSTGAASKDGARTLVSEQCDWGMGPMTMRIVERQKDADNLSMEMYFTDKSGTEKKAMEIAYKRAK